MTIKELRTALAALPDYPEEPDLSEDEAELADFYRNYTEAHAADMEGRLYGEMVISVRYSGNRTDTTVLYSDIEKVEYDPMDE